MSNLDPTPQQPAPGDLSSEPNSEGAHPAEQHQDDGRTRIRDHPIDVVLPGMQGDVEPLRPTSESAEPRQVGDYWLDTPIGRGGFADVFRGYDQARNRVAIKRIRPEVARNPTILAHLENAAHVLQKPHLWHENIVKILDTYRAENTYLLVLEYIDGEDLRSLLDRRQVLPLAEATRIAWHVCRALQHAHSNGIVHCDVKPENILIGKDDQVKVADFDIAAITSPDAETPAAGRAGTAYYMAPEQRRPAVSKIDHRADLYSVGVVLYEMLSGDVPQGIVAPLHKSDPSIPRQLDHLIRRALQPDPERRPQSAMEMMEVLDRYARGARSRRLSLRRGRGAQRLVSRSTVLGATIPLTLPEMCQDRGCYPWCLAAGKDDNVYVAFGDRRTHSGCVMYSEDLRAGGTLRHLQCREPSIMGLPRALAVRPGRKGGQVLLVLSEHTLPEEFNRGLDQTRYTLAEIVLSRQSARVRWERVVESPEDPCLAADVHGNVLIGWGGRNAGLVFLDRHGHAHDVARPPRKGTSLLSGLEANAYWMQVRSVGIATTAGTKEPHLLALTKAGVHRTRLSPEYKPAEWEYMPLQGGHTLVVDPRGYPYVSDTSRIHALHAGSPRSAWSHTIGYHSELAVGQRWLYTLVAQGTEHAIHMRRLGSYWALYTLVPLWGLPEEPDKDHGLAN